MDGSRGEGGPRGRGMILDKKEYKELRRPFSRSVVPTEADFAGGDHADTHKVLMPSRMPSDQDAGDSPSTPNEKGGMAVPQQKTSTLSPYAKEFFPKGFVAPESSPGVVLQHQTYSTNDSADVDSFPLNELREFISDVTMSPAKYDSSVDALTEDLNVYIINEEMLKEVVDLIFDQAIAEPNFRYTAARLCNHLSWHLPVEASTKTFRHLLMDRCCQELQMKLEHLTSPSAESFLRGYILFLAELFSHMQIGGPESTMRIYVLGENLLDVLSQVVSHPSPSRVKCVCQVLKLTGSHLEEHELSKSSPYVGTPRMDKILALLQEYVFNCDEGREVKNMVNSVLELKANNWGRNTPVICDVPAVPEGMPNVPVLYGPDGQPLSAEEAYFLDRHSRGFEIQNGDDIGIEETIYDSDGMDDEIAAAYEEFLRMSRQ